MLEDAKGRHLGLWWSSGRNNSQVMHRYSQETGGPIWKQKSKQGGESSDDKIDQWDEVRSKQFGLSCGPARCPTQQRVDSGCWERVVCKERPRGWAAQEAASQRVPDAGGCASAWKSQGSILLFLKQAFQLSTSSLCACAGWAGSCVDNRDVSSLKELPV